MLELFARVTCADGSVVDLGGSATATDADATGTVPPPKIFRLSTASDAEPLVSFLRSGASDGSDFSVRLELASDLSLFAACYRLVRSAAPVADLAPGFLRAVERGVASRICRGVDRLDYVRRQFSGLERVEAICDVLEDQRATMSSLTSPCLDDLERFSQCHESLYVVYDGGARACAVYNLPSSGDRAPDRPFVVSHTRLPRGGGEGISATDVELLCQGRLSGCSWTPLADGGLERAAFPSLDSIELVVAPAVASTSSGGRAGGVACLYARNRLWRSLAAA